MSKTQLIRTSIETVTSEDHFVETFGKGKPINLNEDRFIEFNGHILRYTTHDPLFKSLRKGDQVRVNVFETEGEYILTIKYEKIN